MSLAIIAVSSTHLQRGSLSTAAPASFPHLKCVAGVSSSLPSSALRQATGYARAPRTTQAPRRLSAEVEQHARALLVQVGPQALPVVDILHCQATLSAQIVESVCLRVAHAVSDAPRRAMTIDQTGTTGVAIALALALQAPVAGRDELILVTAADAWSEVFTGNFSPLVDYRDAVGALLLAQADPEQPAAGDRAHLLAVSCRPAIAREPFWSCAPEIVRQQLCESLEQAALNALLQVGWEAGGVDLLLGESIGPGLAEDLAARLGVREGVNIAPDPEHAASAALVGNIVKAIELADERRSALKCLLWTASADGGVAAVALRALPQIVKDN